jgi:hypothetical protein
VDEGDPQLKNRRFLVLAVVEVSELLGRVKAVAPVLEPVVGAHDQGAAQLDQSARHEQDALGVDEDPVDNLVIDKCTIFFILFLHLRDGLDAPDHNSVAVQDIEVILVLFPS